MDKLETFQGIVFVVYKFTCGTCNKSEKFAFDIPNIYKCECGKEINFDKLINEFSNFDKTEV